MPDYFVTDPQTGRRVKLTGDSPPTEQELEQVFSSLEPVRRGGRDDMAAYQDPETAGMTLGQRMQREAIGGNVTGLAYGAAKPFIGAAQLGMRAGEAVFGAPEGREPLSDIVASGLNRFEQARADAGGSNVPVIAGQVLTGAGATSGITPAAGFLGRAGQAGLMGAGFGAVEPVTAEGDFAAQKTGQVVGGAIAGAGTSLLGSLATTLARRLFPGGAEIEAGRLANELAGERQPQVVQALRQPQGAQVTAAQAAAPARSAEFSALGRRAAQVRPSEFEDIAQAQNAARARELGSIAGTADDIAAAERARSAATGPLYRAAEASQAPVDTSKTVSLVDNLIRSRQGRPQVTSVLGSVRQTLVNAADDAPVTSAQQLINASRNISDLLDARDPMGRKVNQAVARELTAVKRSLDQQIARAAPEFGEAQKLFADLSKPIDRMRVGQYIQERLIPAINDAGADAPQRATVFANAMRDMNESVRQATGFRRGGGIADLMTPDEMQTLQRIGSDLARDVDVQRLARAGQRRATEAVGEMFNDQAPNALSRPLMIINAILRRTGAGASERTMSVLAEKMQDPAAMADIMQKATQAERRAIERGIILYMTNGAVSAPDDAEAWASRAIRNFNPNDAVMGLLQENR